MLNKQNDKPKVVLITGAARRIGAQMVRYFHSHGYNVILHYRNSAQQAQELAASLNQTRNNSVQLIQADLIKLVDTDFTNNLIQSILSFYGSVDVLVNNASSFFPTPLGKVELSDWQDLMVSNAGGPFFLSQALAPYLAKSVGAIINISDIHANMPLKGYSVYSMAKAANNMLTKTLARELAPQVRVNAVAPGPTLWPEAENELDHILKEKILDKILLKRLANPEDIAQTALFLAESQYITGQVIAVDGGRSLKD